MTIPPVRRNIDFGPSNSAREPVQMVHCITADLPHVKYVVISAPEDIYQPEMNYWLLNTATNNSRRVQPDYLRSCMETLRTATTLDFILCFHIIDLYCGKLEIRWWFELIIASLSKIPGIQFLDE